MIRDGGELKVTDWETALTRAADGLKAVLAQSGGAAVGVLASPTATTEELYLLQKLMRGVSVPNIDHRLRQQDFRDQAADPVYPALGMPVAAVATLSAALVVGSHLRAEAPLLAHRLRQAALRNRAAVSFLNPEAFPVRFPVAGEVTVPMTGLAEELGAIALAAAEISGTAIGTGMAATAVGDAHRAIARALCADGNRLVLLGALSARHADFARIRRVAAEVARLTGATLGYVADGGNAAGAALVGVLPHRAAAGAEAPATGLTALSMLESALKAYVLFGGVEVEEDCAAGALGQRSLAAAGFVLAVTPFLSGSVRTTASVVLPIGTFAETSGTFVNAEGRWQSFAAAARAVGESRPGWKVLRVLGNLLNVPGFEHVSSEDVLDELKAALGAAATAPADTAYRGSFQAAAPAGGQAPDVPMYRVDAIVRRAPALQATSIGRLPMSSY